ncbi:hypothetical protein [Ferviditalea candida]|uniref:Citrate transporter-like domain-containing protein n=1 Tax=Ferviditalea candida TaxID=3108399 RepID=A0ABU5ZIT4_9BACL|nr:hypothetical protein [Paenibacillaceae bacterium T2]
MVKYLFVASIAVYIFSNFFQSTAIAYLVAIMAILSVSATIFRVQRFVMVLGLVFLGLGVWMLVHGGAQVQQYILSFGKMLDLLTLFALVPIFALPIRLGNYALSVQEVIRKKIKKSGQLYWITSGLSFLLSSFMNVATLPMMYYSIKSSVDLFPIKDKVRFMSRSITRGFCMPLLWAPVTPIVGIVVEMTKVNWGSMLRIMFPLSVLGLLLDWLTGMLVARRESKRRSSGTAHESPEAVQELASAQEAFPAKRQGRLIHILAAIVIINVLIWASDLIFNMGFLLTVSLLVIPISLAWSLFLGAGKLFFGGLKTHLDTHIAKMKDQFYIFLCAGFFLSAIQVSGFEDQINTAILHIKDIIGHYLFIVLVPIIPFVLAFSGIHPAVALALVAQALDPKILMINPEILTVAMLGGAVPAFLMGPYNATLGIMSNIVNQSNFRLSYWNAPFTALYLLLIMLTLIVLQLIL